MNCTLVRRFALTIACTLTLVWAVTLLAQNTTTRANTNRVIAVAYGSVIGIEQIKLESRAGGGAIVGGLIGLASSGGRSSRTKAGRAAAGAAIGGLGTRAVEGSNQAYEYTVQLVSGQTVKMITDQTGMRLGDCVSVEQGARGNIRRVSSAHCEYADTEPSADHVQEAGACAQAKEGILSASTEAELDLAVKRTRILCED